uniref:Uncharacterized protein n=1 Tax=Candidatus Kentrum sp. TUN TaxID=2126343 RepID=A0A451APQ9_9GAMM|nr:MAG: hypothetical protein BECKTUN1418F_GA0071002_11774 [Candidatus Kentron sp. TUN]VFK59711.1 MAG: hypothetical protein BECKTUN1418D_GA0071000_11074 [Candidatus Kentron sp. TUN]VFK67982.1 MAG: hypothetical protein BECKTUN1418E_GA0071001_11724 [Candidatus Kentron sp. TUN]
MKVPVEETLDPARPEPELQNKAVISLEGKILCTELDAELDIEQRTSLFVRNDNPPVFTYRKNKDPRRTACTGAQSLSALEALACSGVYVSTISV